MGSYVSKRGGVSRKPFGRVNSTWMQTFHDTGVKEYTNRGRLNWLKAIRVPKTRCTTIQLPTRTHIVEISHQIPAPTQIDLVFGKPL